MKKKPEDPPKGSPAWMATFSDLMNLLLCFFVLLFSMSSVDESKAEALMKSLQDTFSIFQGGGSSFQDGVLISSGATQLSNLDSYYVTSGQTDDGESTDNVNDQNAGAADVVNDQNDSQHGEDSQNLAFVGNDKQQVGDDKQASGEGKDLYGENKDDTGEDKDKSGENQDNTGIDKDNTGENDDDHTKSERPEDGSAGNDKELQSGDTLTAEQIASQAAAMELADNKDKSNAIYDEIVGLLDKMHIIDQLEVAVDSKSYEYVQFEISGAVLFDAGKDTVKTEAIPVISRLGDILKQYREYKIEVIGHTDNTPTNPDDFLNNDILSACRAISVATYFAEDKGIGWDNIYYAGRGDHDPVADNATAVGRAQNRRVEIRLYNQKSSN